MKSKFLWATLSVVALVMIVLIGFNQAGMLTWFAGKPDKVRKDSKIAGETGLEEKKEKRKSSPIKGKAHRRSTKNAQSSTVQTNTAQHSPEEILGKLIALMNDSSVFIEIKSKFNMHRHSNAKEEWKRLIAEQKQELRELLASDEFKEFYGLVKELSQFDSVNFNIDYSSIGVDFQTPELKNIIDIEKCLALKSLSNKEEGDFPEAVDPLALGLKLSHQARTDTIPESAMTRMGLDGSLLTQLNDLVQSGNLTAEQTTGLITELASRNYRAALVPSFDTDKLMMDNEFQKMMSGDSKSVEKLATMFGYPQETIRGIVESKETLERNLNACDEYTKKYQDLCSKPLYESKEEIQALQKEIAELPNDYSLVKLLLSGNTSFMLMANFMTDTVNRQLISMATTIYKSRNNGTSPQTPEDLLGILNEIPVNPLTGESY